MASVESEPDRSAVKKRNSVFECARGFQGASLSSSRGRKSAITYPLTARHGSTSANVAMPKDVRRRWCHGLSGRPTDSHLNGSTRLGRCPEPSRVPRRLPLSTAIGRMSRGRWRSLVDCSLHRRVTWQVACQLGHNPSDQLAGCVQLVLVF